MSIRNESRGMFFKQSSELEILISAAIVFAIFKIQDVVPLLLVSMINHNIPNNSPFLFVVALNALYLSTLMPISIVAHFILRFYWLALIGLKNAYQQKSAKELRYASRYQNFINRKYDLDNHIEAIDSLSSSIFAFTFLSIFIFCFSLSFLIILFGFLNNQVNSSDGFLQLLYLIIAFLFLLLCVLTLIDFVTIGGLKRVKKRWFVKIYYPVTRVMSILTLSFIYRGLYYTFISRAPRKLTFIGIPLYIITAIVLLNLGFHESRIFETDNSGARIKGNAILPMYYRNKLDPLKSIQVPFIQSHVIAENYLELNIPLTEEIDNTLVEKCEGVQQVHKRGLNWRRWITTGFNRRDLPEDFDYYENADNALTCVAEAVTISIDAKEIQVEGYKFDVLTDPDKKLISTFIPLNSVDQGLHILYINVDQPFTKKTVEIPFYKAE